jgi:hypothetical protein
LARNWHGFAIAKVRTLRYNSDIIFDLCLIRKGLRDFEEFRIAYNGVKPARHTLSILYVQHRGIVAPIFGVRGLGAIKKVTCGNRK